MSSRLTCQLPCCKYRVPICFRATLKFLLASLYHFSFLSTINTSVTARTKLSYFSKIKFISLMFTPCLYNRSEGKTFYAVMVSIKINESSVRAQVFCKIPSQWPASLKHHELWDDSWIWLITFVALDILPSCYVVSFANWGSFPMTAYVKDFTLARLFDTILWYAMKIDENLVAISCLSLYSDGLLPMLTLILSLYSDRLLFLCFFNGTGTMHSMV